MSIYLPVPQEAPSTPYQPLLSERIAASLLMRCDRLSQPFKSVCFIGCGSRLRIFYIFLQPSTIVADKTIPKKRGKNKRGGRKPGQLLRHVMVQNTEEGCMELWPQIASRSIFPLLKAPSAWVMAARQVLSEVLPQEMRDLGAEKPKLGSDFPPAEASSFLGGGGWGSAASGNVWKSKQIGSHRSRAPAANWGQHLMCFTAFLFFFLFIFTCATC